MVDQLMHRFPADPDLAVTGLAVTWRGRSRLAAVVPAGWATRPSRWPARPSHAAWRLLGWPRLAGFDLVHGPNYIVPPLAGGVGLVTVHDLTAWRYPDLVNRFCRHYPDHLRRAVDAGGHVHAVSAFVGRELVDELGLPDERVHVVPNGFDAGLVGDPDRGRARIGRPYVLAVGTIEPRKDHPTLVEAMAAVWTSLPDVELVIVGADGWGTAMLDRALDRFDPRRRVIRMGYVDPQTKADLLAGALAMAYPSLYEGFGLPVLEAMAAGVPVVTTNAGAIPEVAGRAAVLVEPRDPGALAGALLSVLEDDVVRGRLVSAGRERVTHFDWDRSAVALHQLYRRLVGLPDRRRA
jgi:glycosyltransferase involved in cell wall biosynthesis